MGAFGAVRPVEDNSSYFSAKELPPIVSPAQADQQASLPPIVSGDSQQQMQVPKMQVPQMRIPGPKPMAQIGRANAGLPPIVSSEAIASEPPVQQTPQIQKAPLMQSGASMLAPLVSSEPNDAPLAIDPMMAPPTIIQASSVPTSADNNEDSIQRTQWTSQGHNTRAVSSAGIPLYAGPQGNSVMVSPTELPPIISASSQLVAPIKPMAPATKVSTGSSSIGLPPVVRSSPISSSPVSIGPPVSMTQSPAFESYTPPQSVFSPAPGISSSPTFAPADTPNFFANPPTEPPVVSNQSGGCSTCGGSGCINCGVASSMGSGCSTCGNNGCFDPAHVASRFGTSGSVSDARRYLYAEALYFDRDDGTISNSNFGALNDFDFAVGGRVTFGAKSDALSGREFSYMGIDSVEQTLEQNDPLGRISSRFSSTDGFSDTETTAFRNSVSQTQFAETSFQTIEFNRVTWGWDVIKSFAGIRYFYIDDQYRISSTNLDGESGQFEIQARNNLIGPHIGGEIFYDVGYRLSYSFFTKAGVFANFNRVDTQLENGGAQFLDVEDDNITVSSSIELGLLGHYQLSRTARLRAGYNILFFGDVASVSDNFNPVLSPSTGTSTSDSDSMFFHGASIGIEIFR